LFERIHYFGLFFRGVIVNLKNSSPTDMFKYLISTIFILFVVSGFGQPDGPFPDDSACGGPFDPCPIPLDGGVSILIAAGLIYGGKKVNDLNKKD